jgi:hypothetical protein
MDQSKMEQKLERLMAMRDKAEAIMDANLVKASLVRTDAWIEKIKAEMKASHQKKDSCLGKTKASPETTEACPVKTEAEREPTPKEIEAVEEPQ